jgi:hypothetical protein
MASLTAEQLTESAKLSLAMAPLYVWSTSFVKISLIFTILRFLPSKAWLIFLYGLIVFLFLLATSALLTEKLRCRPLQAEWDLQYPSTDCFSMQIFTKVVLFVSSKQLNFLCMH